MIEKPFEAIAGLAKKVQVVAIKVALKAAKVSEAMARKVASIEARAATKAQARAHAAALKALPRKPTVEFLRKVRHGRTSVSFYRVTNHRAGEVRYLWALNRVTPRGQERIAVGPMSEFHSLRSIANRSLAQGVKARQGVERGPTQQAESPRQRNAVGPRTSQGERSEDRGQSRWYTLIYIEKLAPDGTGKGRVVRNFTSLKEAEALQMRHPGLIIQERTAERPLRQGEVVNLKLSNDVKPTQAVDGDRQNSVKQERPKLAIAPPAIRQEQQQRSSLGR